MKLGYRLLAYAGLILAVLGLIVFEFNPFDLAVGGGHSETWALRRLKARVYGSVSAGDETGFERLDPNDLGGWLSNFKEYPQPFEEYTRADVNRPEGIRRVIALQQLGPMAPGELHVLELLREYVGVSFQLTARIEKPLQPGSPDESWLTQPPSASWSGHKIDAVQVLNRSLVRRIPPDAVAYFGITLDDLAARGLAFVFGVGSYQRRVGVYSLCRFFPEFWHHPARPGDGVLALRRSCKVLDHELGHIFGLSHCVFYKCVMNGSNSLFETDEQPLHFCPVCLRKLEWNLGLDRLRRYRAQQEFFQRNGLIDEATWCQGQIAKP